MPGITSGLNVDARKTALDELFFPAFTYDQLPGVAHAESPVLFRQKPATAGAVVTEELGATGLWETETEEEERGFTSVQSKNQKTHEIIEYRKTIPIPQTFYEDDKHDVVDQMIEDAGRKGRMTRDQKALQVYVKGFADVTTSDDVYLWSSSHVTVSGDTLDNLETGVFNADNFEVLYKSLVEQKGPDGELGGNIPAALFVPIVLYPDAQETLKSELKPYKTDNELNWVSMIYPNLLILQSAWIGAAYASFYANAATAHYLVGPNHSITRWERIPLETKLIPPDTDLKDRWFYKGRFREVVKVISPYGAVASTGAA